MNKSVILKCQNIVFSTLWQTYCQSPSSQGLAVVVTGHRCFLSTVLSLDPADSALPVTHNWWNYNLLREEAQAKSK